MEAGISAEQLPAAAAAAPDDLQLTRAEAEQLDESQMAERVEQILLARLRDEPNSVESLFQLGQLYFEQARFPEALPYFERGADLGDLQAIFQQAVLLFDGVCGQQDAKRGVALMTLVTETAKAPKDLVWAAYFNLGRAHFQGVGVTRASDSEAERLWLLAADDGNPRASVRAQTMLGMFYSRDETRDLKKAFFWHSEACGNGSLESQGCLGVMYFYGLGVKARDLDAAFTCLREAAERGNVHACGHLVYYYYHRKLYTKAQELAARVAQFEDYPSIAAETDCLPGYVAKGVAMACFFYARCLHQGHAVKVNKDEANVFYSKSYRCDPDVCAELQNLVTLGEI